MTENRPFTFDRVARILITIACVVGAIWLIDYLSGVLLPFAVACVLAYTLNPMVEYNCRLLHLKNRVVPAILTLVELVMIVTLVSYCIFPFVVSEISELVAMLKEYNQMNTNGKFISEGVHEFIRTHINVEDISKLLTKEQWVNFISTAANKTWSVLGTTLTAVFAIVSWVVVILYLVFLLIDYPKIKDGFKRAIPHRYKNVTLQILQDIRDVMHRYFRGQLLIACIVGVLYSMGFMAIGLPLGLVLGLFVGVLNIVPYLQVVSYPFALILCLVDSMTTGGNFWVMLLEVTAVYGIVQVIQDMYITPRIMGKQMGLNPVFVFLSLSIWGTLLGFIGLIVALPLTALVTSYYKRYVLSRPPVDTVENK